MAGPIGLRKMPVACCPWLVRDDSAFVADDSIEECRLADVRPANQGDDRNVHATAPARRGSPSCTRTSAKSYDGKTGTGIDSRRAMNDSSSRNTPLSLIHSAGISARSRS